MSIRDELAKLIAQHEAPGWRTWTDERGQNHTVWHCICGWKQHQDGWDSAVANQHFADVILTRFGVVELPEERAESDRSISVFPEFWGPQESWIARSNIGDVMGRDLTWLPEDVRAEAAAMIAAANRAEGQS